MWYANATKMEKYVNILWLLPYIRMRMRQEGSLHGPISANANIIELTRNLAIPSQILKMKDFVC